MLLSTFFGPEVLVSPLPVWCDTADSLWPISWRGICKPLIPNSTKNRGKLERVIFSKRFFQSLDIPIRLLLTPSDQTWSNVFLTSQRLIYYLILLLTQWNSVSSIKILCLSLDNLAYLKCSLTVYIF